jgi:zinc protease
MPAFLAKITTCLSALLLASSMAAPAHALALPDGIAQGDSIEGVTQYTLNNGLRVLLAPDSSNPTTTVNMTYLVGSRNENYGQTGMAHLLEHMLFRGTPTLHNALAEFSKRGLQANGSTSNDHTSFYASFAADPASLSWFLRWQADAMVNSLIAKTDLDSEMTVVRNEMERNENSPFQVLLQKMQAAAYQWHNYGHNTIGARSDVENVDVGQLHAFYQEYYQPDNAVLIVSGKFDAATVLQTIASAFLKLPRPTRALPHEYTVEPVQDGERQVTLRRQGGSPLIGAMFHIPAASSPDYIPLNLGVAILGDTPSGRLYRALVEHKLGTSVFGYSAGLRQPGYAAFGAQLAPGMDQAKALDIFENTLGSLAEKPFTQAELDRIKSKWTTDWNQVYADPPSLADALADAASDGDWRLFFLARDQVEKVTLAAVQRTTQDYLVRSNRTVGLYIPTDKPVRAPTPQAIDLKALFKDYRGRKAEKETSAFDPSPAHIDANTLRTPLSLPNGTVKLALLPKPTRGNQVEATLVIQFGTADTLKGQRTISSAVASLLDHGTPALSRQAIQDKFDALQANVSFGGGAGVLVANLTTTEKHLPALVGLVLEIVRNADFPAAELAEYQRRAEASIKNAQSEPSAVASRALDRHDNPWASDDIRYTPTFGQALHNIESLTRQNLVDFHQKFYGAGQIEFAAAGAFDAGAVKAALSAGLKGWKKAPEYQRIADPYRAVAPQQFDIDTPDKSNAFYLSVLPVKIQDTDPDYPALYLANYLLGGSETSRLWNRIRVKDGLSYEVRSGLSASSFEPAAAWTIYAITAPQNTLRLRQAVQDELARALRDGFTSQEVQEGIASVLNYRKLARAQDGVIANTWANYMQLDRSFKWWEGMDRKLAALTADQVNAALRATLKPNLFSTAIAAAAAGQKTAAR